MHFYATLNFVEFRKTHVTDKSYNSMNQHYQWLNIEMWIRWISWKSSFLFAFWQSFNKQVYNFRSDLTFVLPFSHSFVIWHLIHNIHWFSLDWNFLWNIHIPMQPFNITYFCLKNIELLRYYIIISSSLFCFQLLTKYVRFHSIFYILLLVYILLF